MNTNNLQDAVNFSDINIKPDLNKSILEQTGINIEPIDELISLQKMLNDVVDPDWIQNLLDWKLAIQLETAEAVDSLNWKWWKKGKDDWINFEIEMIDMFFFTLAKIIETNQEQAFKTIMISYMVAEKTENSNIKIIRDNKLSKQVQEFIRETYSSTLSINQYLLLMSHWVKIWKMIGNDFEYLFKLFKVKYLINIFRQSHGYKEGTYIKIWGDLEDNKAALMLVKDIPYDSNFDNVLMNKLEEEYIKVVQLVNKSFDKFITGNQKYLLIINAMPDDVKKLFKDVSEDYYNYMKLK